MNEERTIGSKDSSSFEDQVFARFDRVEQRLILIDERLEKLQRERDEEYQQWQRVLKLIKK